MLVKPNSSSEDAGKLLVKLLPV